MNTSQRNPDYRTSAGLPDRLGIPRRGLQVTGFTAGRAIIYAVFAQADVMQALAERAIFIAGAASLRLVTHHAGKVFRHNRRLARFCGWGNGPMVDGLAGDS
jgi:hypothetical protein